MPHEPADFNESLVIRGGEADLVAFPAAKVKLLFDSNECGGALSTVTVRLDRGADGAPPHIHKRSTEMFYVLDGVLEVLSGTKILTAGIGDIIVIPPGLPHAFASAPETRTKVLIVIAPGIERFEYFRLLARILHGQDSFESLRGMQEQYDTYFLDSPEWESRHANDVKSSGL